ncbi:MAG TPA: hypothetical protein VGD37_39355 [Kofleriaceae bacterium]
MQLRNGMWTACGDGNCLEDVFSVLRFRRRGMVSFRKFIILNAQRGPDANALHLEEAATQPLRVLHR